jgi:hypothetical protein
VVDGARRSAIAKITQSMLMLDLSRCESGLIYASDIIDFSPTQTCATFSTMLCCGRLEPLNDLPVRRMQVGYQQA